MWDKHVIENLSLLFVVTEREHVGMQSTQGTLALEHAKHAAHEHVSMQGTLAREHVSTQATFAHEYVSTQDT